MKVTLRSRGRHGRTSRTIRVTTNDPRNSNLVLTCEGVVRGAFKGPSPRLRFGRVTRDLGPQTKTVTIHRGDGGPITPEISPIKGHNVAAALREIKAGEQYELDVTIRPPWPNRRMTSSFNIKTGVPEAPEEVVIVTADVVPRVRTVPERFIIPHAPTEDTEVTAQVVWDREGPERVIKAEISDEQLSVRIEDQEGQQTVVVSVPAGYTGPPRAPNVTLTTDDQQMKVVTIRTRYDKRGRQARSAAAISPRPVGKAPQTGRSPSSTAIKLRPHPVDQKPLEPKEATSVSGSEKPTGTKKPPEVKVVKKAGEKPRSSEQSETDKNKQEEKAKKDSDR